MFNVLPSKANAAIGRGKQTMDTKVCVCVCLFVCLCVPLTRGHEWVLRLLLLNSASLLGLLFFSFTRCKVLILFFRVCLHLRMSFWQFVLFVCYSFYDFKMLFFRVGTSTHSRLDVFNNNVAFVALACVVANLLLLEFVGSLWLHS